MRIDLDYLIECDKCGCVFNYMINAKISHESDYVHSKIYTKACPCCKNEVKVFS